MIGVVLDTNVVVSANLNDEGLESFVVSLALNQQLQLYISEPIFREYERVLRYPRLKFLPQDVTRFLNRVREAGILVRPTHPVAKAKHEPDNRFLECAEAAGAAYLISGNIRHFPVRWKTTRIVNARQFVEVLGAEQATDQ
jgi:putative PIN family toxin of toxin-antitoxin system